MPDAKTKPCPACDGAKTCTSCDGTGFVDRLVAMICAICNGDGICGVCRGTGEVEDEDE